LFAGGFVPSQFVLRDEEKSPATLGTATARVTDGTQIQVSLALLITSEMDWSINLLLQQLNWLLVSVVWDVIYLDAVLDHKVHPPVRG